MLIKVNLKDNLGMKVFLKNFQRKIMEALVIQKLLMLLLLVQYLRKHLIGLISDRGPVLDIGQKSKL